LNAILSHDIDPCLRRTRGGMPCSKSAHHVGACHADRAELDLYIEFVRNLRVTARTMTPTELKDAAEYHRVAWIVFRGEYNAR
jgi:hypothetical protein